MFRFGGRIRHQKCGTGGGLYSRAMRRPIMRFLAGTLLVGAVAGCARGTPEQQFIGDAMEALGGRSRIEAVRTLTVEGEGINYNLGQDMKPEAATQQFAVTGYKRQIDI